MVRIPLRTHLLRRLPLPARYYSSGSPSPSNVPANHFIKTGEREASDPTAVNLRRDEYSQSGGDDMVAEQSQASFSKNADSPVDSKETAGKGNVVNPLDFSPATPELSEHTEAWVEKGVEWTEGMRTGKGVTRKSKTVVKSEIDFDTVKHKSGGS
ncbi:hypothetical protein SLS60_008957 [Paraconiothyrium brasiliense]|uniref:Uncharacterized protein n=1 Tax=Paraconiothyrium brasiliense TaxID=300254 RepID=A0ABR3QVX9_9PLEO